MRSDSSQPGECRFTFDGPNQLANVLADVVKVESPVHCTEAARRVLSGAGVQRLGLRIQEVFEEAMSRGLARKQFARRADFLWSLDMQLAPVRDRSVLPAASRKLELIAPEEIRHAILIVVKEAYGIVREEVSNTGCRLLGFARMTDEMRAAVEPHRDAPLREGFLKLNGLNLVAVPQPLVSSVNCNLECPLIDLQECDAGGSENRTQDSKKKGHAPEAVHS